MNTPTASLLASLALLTPTLAHAGAAIGVDLELGAPIAPGMRYGASVGARVGYRFDLGPVWVQPEVGGAFMSFQASPEVYGVDMPRLFGGARLGLGVSRVVQPALYGQGGIGWQGVRGHGPLGSVGLALDIAIVPHFTFGAQVAYNALAKSELHGTTAIQPLGGSTVLPTLGVLPSIQWISAGLHGGFTF